MKTIKIIKRNSNWLCTVLLVCVLLVMGCKKAKIDSEIPQTNVINNSASGIRVFNFYGLDQEVTVNNIPLTAYRNGSNNNQGGGATQIGLSIFPTGIWSSTDNGNPFTIPNSLIDKSGKVRLIIGNVVDTLLQNNALKPQDYYLLNDSTLRIFNRERNPPADPQNFKIRIINLGNSTDVLGLTKPLSLTYADGSLVDGKLSNIALGNTSGYVELPYGAYQFKLFAGKTGGGIDTKKQLAEVPSFADYNPCAGGVQPPQENISCRVRTFLPGAVYSIVVTSGGLLYQCQSDQSDPVTAIVNSYRIITELDPGVNNTYARMQAVNALPGKQITIKVDGKIMGNELNYIGLLPQNTAQRPDYSIYIRGDHKVQAFDQNGNMLAERPVTLFPFDNYTIWAYEKPDGKPDLLFEANDMTSTLYASNFHPGSNTGNIPDDGTNGAPRRTRYPFAWQSRFLNLSPDLPYTTFANDYQLFLPAVEGANGDTIRSFNAYVNLASGVMPKGATSIIYSIPYIPASAIFNGSNNGGIILPRQIRAYRSSPAGGGPADVPGSLITSIQPLESARAFVANRALYSPGNVPVLEMGVYTTALIGRVSNAANQAAKAKIIVIKHNK